MVAGSASAAVSSSAGAVADSGSAADSSSSGAGAGSASVDSSSAGGDAASGSESAGGSSCSSSVAASGAASAVDSSSSAAAAGADLGSGAAVDSSAAGAGSGSGGGVGSEEHASSATTTSVRQATATTDFSLAFISRASWRWSGPAPPTRGRPSDRADAAGILANRPPTRSCPGTPARWGRREAEGVVGRVDAGVLRLRCASLGGPRLDGDAAAVLDVHAQAVAVEQ